MMMFKTQLAVALALTLAAPAISQEAAPEEAPATEAPATEAPETEAPAAEAPATDAPAGEAPAEDALGLGPEAGAAEGAAGAEAQQPYVAEEFGAWQLRCLPVEEGATEPCQIYQLLLDEQDNPVAEASVVALPPGEEAAAGVVLIVPLETLLPEGLTITVDGGEPLRYEFDFCNRAGCVVRFGLTPEQVGVMKRGSQAQVRIVPALAPDQEVVLPMSLSGFTAGFDETAARLPAE